MGSLGIFGRFFLLLVGILVLNGFILWPISFDALAGEAFSTSREFDYQQQRQAQYNLVKAVQKKLIEKGYDPGRVDGISGPRTKKAVEAFQKKEGLIVDGIPGAETLKALGLK
jgi:peptidoglycan hydrolase-like protein with peptidoglycan-binding domain